MRSEKITNWRGRLRLEGLSTERLENCWFHTRKKKTYYQHFAYAALGTSAGRTLAFGVPAAPASLF